MPDAAALDELLMGTARALRRRWAERLAPSDLTPHDVRALRAIGTEGPLRLGALAERLRIAPRSATDVVDRLTERDLVTRTPDPADRRAATVALTESGRDRLDDVSASRRLDAAEFFGALTSAEQAQLARLLTKLDPGGRSARPH